MNKITGCVSAYKYHSADQLLFENKADVFWKGMLLNIEY